MPPSVGSGAAVYKATVGRQVRSGLRSRYLQAASRRAAALALLEPDFPSGASFHIRQAFAALLVGRHVCVDRHKQN